MRSLCRILKRLRVIPAGERGRRSRFSMRLPQPEVLEERRVLAVNALQAVHRSGQTFLTWTEDSTVSGESYHVYRSTSPITSSNLAQAEKLTLRWGPLDDATSVNKGAAPGTEVPANFVIADLASPLSDNTGLFVWTTPAAESGTWYYAVTQVTNGIEDSTVAAGVSTLITGVTEATATPQPVLTWSVNGGKGRIYTQYMDYAKWNPTFQGYAYNYSVALPYNYTPSVQWPLRLMPHAYGERFRLEPEAEYQWQCIELFVDDPGGTSHNTQTWWYGFAADHNYLTSGDIPTSGKIENFTEQRVLKAIDEVSSTFSVNTEHIFSQGNSMGASGSLSWGIRYGNVFSGIFASEPMTNYRTTPTFIGDFERLWGTEASNLQIVNNGPYAASLKQYDNMGVYDWMNHQSQMVNMRSREMAFLMVGHGKSDTTIDWLTQGKPFIQTLNATNAGFTAEQRFGWDHTWMSFGFSAWTTLSPQTDDLSSWEYDRSLSFPSITNATGSGPSVPGTSGTNFYNTTIEWSVPWHSFHTGILDTATRYEISLRSTSAAQVAEVTPRRLQSFVTPAGTVVRWKNVSNSTGLVVQSGTVTADAAGLVTIPRFQIGLNTGNRLLLEIGTPVPVISQPGATTLSMTPQIAWSKTTDAVSYDIWLSNLSNPSSGPIRLVVSGTSFTPAAPLGIGRYRFWVRGVKAAGTYTAWSAALTFQINTQVVLNSVPAPVITSRPVVSWTALAGAVRYELSLKNRTTQQNNIVNSSNITATSFQFASPLTMGTYDVWVRGIDASGTSALWSVGQSFIVVTPPLQTGPELSTFSVRPVYQWQAVPGAVSYQVFVENAQTRAVVLDTSSIATTSFTQPTDLAAGDYRWWVRARGPAGITGAWSSPRNLNIGGRPTVLNVAGAAGSVRPEFLWTPVQNAVRYELWVTRIGTGVVINQTSLTTASYTPPSDLAAGTYRIWVRAVSTTGTVSAWSLPVDIVVSQTDSTDQTAESVLAWLPMQLMPVIAAELSDGGRSGEIRTNTQRIPCDSVTDMSAAIAAARRESSSQNSSAEAAASVHQTPSGAADPADAMTVLWCQFAEVILYESTQEDRPRISVADSRS